MCYIHAAELKAVSVSLVMWGQVIVVEDSDAEHSWVDAGAEKEDGDEARHLEVKKFRSCQNLNFGVGQELSF